MVENKLLSLVIIIIFSQKKELYDDVNVYFFFKLV